MGTGMEVSMEPGLEATTQRRPLPPRRREEELPGLWVFVDDPMLVRRDFRRALAWVVGEYDVHLLDADGREAAIIEASVGRRSVPAAVLFGPAAVRRLDPHLRLLADHADVRLLLVNDHDDRELLDMAGGLARVDGHLILPFAGEDLAMQLELLVFLDGADGFRRSAWRKPRR